MLPEKPTPKMTKAIEDYYLKWQRLLKKKADRTKLHADCWQALQVYKAMYAVAPRRHRHTTNGEER